jgi:hypothetical protein
LPDSLNYPALVQDISNIMPGNPIIDEWLAAYANGAGVAGVDYNGPTEEQILNSVQILQQGFWDFGNPSPPAGTGPDFTQVADFFHQLYEDIGITPGQGVAAASTDPSAAVAGGLDSNQLTSDLNTLAASFGTTTLSTDLSALLASLDATTLSTDLSTMLESLASTLPADLATTLPSSLLSSF